jgi:hypothetical protein
MSSTAFSNFKSFPNSKNENLKPSTNFQFSMNAKKIDKPSINNSNKEYALDSTTTDKIIKKMSHIQPVQPSFFHPSTTKNNLKTKSLSGSKILFLDIHKDIYKQSDKKKTFVDREKNM